MTTEAQRLRLFLDTSVIIAGCTQPWGASKAVCILVTQRDRYTLVLAEQVEREVQTALAAKIAPLSTVEAQEIAASMAGWFNRVRLERWPGPSRDYLKRHEGILLPVLRHVNDLPAAAAALQAQPDWIISSNRVHWNDDLAVRMGLRIVSPQEFMQRLSPS